MNNITKDKEALLRAALHVPPTSKEHLHRWVQVYLGIDLPNCTVCSEDEEHPPSNSNPMDMLWEMYSAALEGTDPKKTYYLYYAARDTYKSVLASIMEALYLFILRRDCAHLAAIKDQANNVVKYLRDYLRRPILRDFVTSKNEWTVEVYSPVDVKTMSADEVSKLKMSYNRVKIVVATMSGVNSFHSSAIVLDELDLAPAKPVQDALMMASPGKERGELPLISMTSTRKFPFGLVQKSIDEAEKTGLIVRHWNLIDVTEKCPANRHMPEFPKIPIYRDSERLISISEKDWSELPPDEQGRFVKDEGYRGCLERCSIFAACRGRLATKQTSTSPLLKKVTHVQALLEKVELDTAKAQLLCWRPSSEGLIFPRLDASVHMLRPHQIAERVTGEKYSEKMTKAELVSLVSSREVRWYAGMDFGYTHNFVVVVGFRDGNRMYIVDVISQSELDLGQMIDVCNKRLKPYNANVYADTEDPGRIETLRKSGLRMRKWHKIAGSVVGGIEIIRLKLWPAIGKPELYFLAGDEGVQFLFQKMQQFHWKTDGAGRVSDVPDEDGKDENDALRYLVMNVFAPGGSLKVAKEEPVSMTPAQSIQHQKKQVMNQQWQQLIDYSGLGTSDGVEEDVAAPKAKGKKGGFTWEF
jgi:hypothetical protein